MDSQFVFLKLNDGSRKLFSSGIEETTFDRVRDTDTETNQHSKTRMFGHYIEANKSTPPAACSSYPLKRANNKK